MADDFATIRKWSANLEQAVSGEAVKRILIKAGTAGKKAALDAAGDTLGGDRKFSHWRGKPALSAGFDVSGPSEVTVKFRPPGLWKLAESGRKNSGDIYPRSGSGRGTKGSGQKFRRAVTSFTHGQHAPAIKFSNGDYVAHSRYGRSRGVKTYSRATKKASTTVPKAAHEQFVAEVGKVLH